MRRRNTLIVVLLVTAAIPGSGWLWYQWKFPYGYSHCCDKCLMFALDQYAREHGGSYPAGEATPEASLSLHYPQYASAELLRGKTVPVEVVQAVLDRGERLGPETCAWHYVEGLTLSDNRKLALVWDKAGLGHFGERLPNGGHTVLFVNLGNEYVPGSDWDGFLEEQNKLLGQRNRPTK